MRTWTLRDFLRFASRGAGIFFLGMLLASAVGAADGAADVVRFSRSGTRAPGRQTGKIIDYTGKQLTLELAGGNRVRIPADRVLSIDTTRVEAHRAANRLLADGHPAQALTLYRRAVRAETRTWMRRWILADTCRCYAQLGQLEQARDTFLILLHSDPNTPWFDAIPLCWTARSTQPDAARRTRGWLDSAESPVEELIAASWLLASTADRTRALEHLRKLAAGPDARVAGLAIAQRWRTEVATATAEDVARWRKQLIQLPASLRGGPYYLLGQVLARLGNHQESAIAFMRIPILFVRQRSLAADALWAAGQQLEQLNQLDEAVGVYRELARTHDDNPLAATARQRLTALAHENMGKRNE